MAPPSDTQSKIAIWYVCRGALCIASCCDRNSSGAGITGLALAAFLSTANQPNLQIDVYEAKSEVSADGSGIAVWKRTWQVLMQLGFEKDCQERGIRTPREGECESNVSSTARRTIG